jgi:hypothetical protein
MQSKLDKLKLRLKEGSGPTLSTEFYMLAKELGCLPELIGREYVVEYDDQNRISKIIQIPMSIPTFIELMDEMQADYERQKKQMKSKRRKK